MTTEPKRMPGNAQSGFEGDLRQFLQENTPLLLSIIRSYVVRAGLAHGNTVQFVAVDILQDAVLEALAHADRLDAGLQPKAWFLAIAANILKRKRAEVARRQQREILVSDISNHGEEIDEGDFFDQIVSHVQPGPEQAIEGDEQVVEMLSLVSPGDQEVLRLALLNDLDTSMLARILGVTPGTARVRLHRALTRLRAAWGASRRKESDADG